MTLGEIANNCVRGQLTKSEMRANIVGALMEQLQHRKVAQDRIEKLEKERDDLLEQIKSIRNDSYKFGYKEAIKGKPMMTFEQYVNYKRIDEREGE